MWIVDYLWAAFLICYLRTEIGKIRLLAGW
jgi:hypothetical protein